MIDVIAWNKSFVDLSCYIRECQGMLLYKVITVISVLFFKNVL